uniref:Uncharacterized protein n=1 Tax=Aegilops tauschii subsp. strangulata TaxID=200361 RepID=A0A453R5Y1_AEGTS
MVALKTIGIYFMYLWMLSACLTTCLLHKLNASATGLTTASICIIRTAVHFVQQGVVFCGTGGLNMTFYESLRGIGK